MRRRKNPEAWVVADDEFHPDPRVAASAADLVAIRSKIKRLKDELRAAEKELAEREES